MGMVVVAGSAANAGAVPPVAVMISTWRHPRVELSRK